MGEISELLIKDLNKSARRKHKRELKNLEKHYDTLNRFREIFIDGALFPTTLERFGVGRNFFRVAYVTFALYGGTVIVMLNLYVDPNNGKIDKFSYLYIDEKNRVNLGYSSDIDGLKLMDEKKISKVLNYKDLINKEIFVINEKYIVRKAHQLLRSRMFFFPFKAQKPTYDFFEGIF